MKRRSNLDIDSTVIGGWGIFQSVPINHNNNIKMILRYKLKTRPNCNSSTWRGYQEFVALLFNPRFILKFSLIDNGRLCRGTKHRRERKFLQIATLQGDTKTLLSVCVILGSCLTLWRVSCLTNLSTKCSWSSHKTDAL